MTPNPLFQRKSRIRFGVGLALGSMLVMSCGGNPAGAPGQGAANLPPQTNPAVKDGDKDKKGQDGVRRTLKGTVVDAFTGEPVSKVTMFVEGVTTTVSSTPIPPAPKPKASASPAGGGAEAGSAGGPFNQHGGPFQVAQVDPDTDTPPDLDNPGMSPDPFGSPSPMGSMMPGMSPSPGMSPMVGASMSPSPAAAGASTAPKAEGPEEAKAPTPAGTPYPLKELKVDSRGKFELKDLPDGTFSVTLWAPGYQAQTFQGKLPEELEVKLRPLTIPEKGTHELKGVVRQANNQPAGNVEIEASSLLGQVPGAHETSDDSGTFNLKKLLPGNYAVAAWTTNLDGELNTFAMVKEVPVAVGRERRTVSPTLVLRAVTGPWLFSGTVEGTIKEETEKAAKAAGKPVEGVRPQVVRAYIQAGDGEIPIMSVPVGKDGYFRMRLPQLPEGVTYHLVASGMSTTGDTVYLHRYNLSASDPKLSFQLPDGPGGVTVVERSTGPDFSWEAKDADVAAYRLALEEVGEEGETLWEGWTTGTSLNLPNSKEFGLLKEGESYRYSLTAIKLAEDGKLDLTTLAAQPWSQTGLTKPETFEVVRLKAGQKPAAAPLKPSAKPGAPKAGASATPAPKGTPSSKRIKTMDDL